MATQVQFRGGTTTEHSSFNGVAREVTVDTTKKTLVVQDGSTNGGFPLLRQDLDNLPAGTIATADIADLGVTTGKIADLGVTTGKIAADAVTEAKIANDAVGAEHIEVLDAALQFGDSVVAQFGADNDLEIQHTGSNAHIDNNIGHTYFNAAGNFYFQTNNTEAAITCTANGGVDLYWDTALKLQTIASGVKFLDSVYFDNQVNAGKDISWLESPNKMRWEDSVKATFGADDDLQIYHENTNNTYIQNATGNLRIDGDSLALRAYTTGDNYLVGTNGAEVKLYYDNHNVAETGAAGLLVGRTNTTN